MDNSSFLSFPSSSTGLLYDDSNHESYPIKYYHVTAPDGCHVTASDRSYYGFVYDGTAIVTAQGVAWYVGTSCAFSCSGAGMIQVSGSAILIEVDHTSGEYPKTRYKAQNVLTGALEPEGRLKYIDGCTDSLLIPPVKMGDPCLNHLHFPAGIDQTAHTHPSHRIGIVAKGSGRCVTPFGDVELTEGLIFIIKEWDGKTDAEGLDGKRHPVGTHKFQTFEGSMDVIAFHPDSDFGATDSVHPMINRTIVDGVSASNLPDIQTK